MAQRVVDPPMAELDRLANALTDGERLAIDFFNEYLPPEWEMYIQPHLNGLRPDLVLLNPAVGIAVFEVKDWDLDRVEYYVDSRQDVPEIAARGNDGQPIVLNPRNRNPLAQVARYQDEVLNLYCPRLETSYGAAARQAVTAGIIMTGATTERAEQLLSPLRTDVMRAYPSYYPISGFDDLRSEGLRVVFPESQRQSSQVMSEAAASDLRGWLREPAFSREQRTPLALDAGQREVATTRTQSGYRRVRGPAGSGKTVALASRAAELAKEGKRVLVCTYNITLMNYIRDKAAQWARSQGRRRPDVEFLNFHSWCKRVWEKFGKGSEYRALWEQAKDQEDRDQLSNVLIPKLTESMLREAANRTVADLYDAILVDEGQDFLPSWWSALRAALAEGGEMLLVADMTQNVYGTANVWTDAAMRGSGFSGPWFQLERSYRLPPSMIPVLKRYADTHLAMQDVDLPELDQQELHLWPVDLKWIQTDRRSAVDACAAAITDQMSRLRQANAVADIVFLAGHDVGAVVVQRLEQKGIRVRHTFDDGQVYGRGRRLKLAFFQGDERVKATTLHSFKGWEAAQLIIYVDSAASARARALFYAALTRIQRLESGSALTVVSSAANLAEFGKTWPSHEAFRRAGDARPPSWSS